MSTGIAEVGALGKLILSFCVSYGCEPAVEYTSVNARYLAVLESIAVNPSREAALTAQESAWNPRARSRFAAGLRQFTPSTGKWAAKTICRGLGSYQPLNAMWSLQCGVIYVEWLEAKKPLKGADYCLNRRVAEQRYNGGWRVLDELRKSKSSDLALAKKYCRRAAWACKENYSYPVKIDRKQVKYVKQGMSGTPCAYKAYTSTQVHKKEKPDG